MNTEIPVYDIIIDENSIGLTAISLVDSPAIMENWIAFSKQQMIWMSSRDKREVIAPLLIPDQLILRKADDGSLYYIRWRRDTILQAAEKYIANGFFNNFTYMHPTFYNKDMKYEDALEKDVFMIRMWTIEDEKNDDANTKYGFHLPEGTLMCHFKVFNRKLWQKIKDKEVLGCSIEAFTNMVRNNNNVNIKVNNMDVNSKQLNLFQKFINFLNEVSSEAEAISDIAKKDEAESGEVSLKYYIDDEHFIEVDGEGFARDEEYNLVAEGEYLLADGNTLVVDSNNKFVETKTVGDKEVEETPVEAPIAEKKVDEENEEDKIEDEGAEGEPSTDSDDTKSEGDTVGDTEDIEAPAEEGDEPKVDEVPTEEVPTEEPTEEVPTEEIPSALVPFEIDGVEYNLPQEVVDYINSLKSANEATLSELSLMKERMPSASPIPAVIKQGAAESDETDGLFEAVRLLNRKR